MRMIGSKTPMLGSNTPMHRRGAGGEDKQHVFKEVEDFLPPLLSKESTKMAGLRPSNVKEKYGVLVITTSEPFKDFQKIKSYATYGHGQSRT